MAKNGYRFNPETLSFDKIETTLKKRLKILTGKFFSTVSLAIVIFFVISSFIDSPKEKALKREKEEILAQYQILNNEVERIDGVLKDLETRDDNIYRVIFESEPIDASIRRAGSGGTNKYEYLKDMSNSKILINTSRKIDELSKAIYIQSKSYDEVEKLVLNKVEMLASIPAIIPISLKNKSNRIASGFGYRIHPLYKTTKQHTGMDFSAPIGTPIYATGNGTVTYCNFEKGYGKHVIIDHGFNYTTLYGHMNDYNVTLGQKVKRGDIIGHLGNTGLSTGPHVHYEVRKNNVPLNPINFYFNDLTPDEYDLMIAEADNSGQTMD